MREKKGPGARGELLRQILDLLFPAKCPFCGRVLDTPGICTACRKALPWIPEDAVLGQAAPDIPCAAPLWYEGLAREGLHRFKFQGMISAAEALGELVAQCAAEQFSGEFDTVTWVPVSPRRLRQRGYDQARLLAESACRLWDTAPEPLVRKAVHNPAQSTLDGAARQRNVAGVYQAEQPDRIAGRRILLVDDIVTTGSTLASCARVLLDAGAAGVACVAVARTRLRTKEDPSPRETDLNLLKMFTK